MKFKHVCTLTAVALIVGASQALAGYWWEDDVGGIFNIPPEEYNPTYYGYGSDGDIVYNKIDLQTGENMYIIADTLLFDNLGNKVATAEASVIGWDHETDFRDGGIIAGAIQGYVGGRVSHHHHTAITAVKL